MWHTSAVEVAEWDAPVHSVVQEERGAEATALGVGGGASVHLQGIHRLWEPLGDGDLLPIPGAGDIGGKQRLEISGQELIAGKGGVEDDDKNPR